MSQIVSLQTRGVRSNKSWYRDGPKVGGGNPGIPKIVRRILATPWIKIVDPRHILGRIVNPCHTLIVMEDHPRSSGGAPGWSDNLKNCRSFSFQKLVGPAIPVQWPSATELVHSRMCSKKLTLTSWTGLVLFCPTGQEISLKISQEDGQDQDVPTL